MPEQGGLIMGACSTCGGKAGFLATECGSCQGKRITAESHQMWAHSNQRLRNISKRQCVNLYLLCLPAVKIMLPSAIAIQCE